jgi:hypothetical protein
MSQCQIGYIFVPITFVNTAELGFLPSKKHGDKPLRDKRHMVDTIEKSVHPCIISDVSNNSVNL